MNKYKPLEDKISFVSVSLDEDGNAEIKNKTPSRNKIADLLDNINSGNSKQANKIINDIYEVKKDE